MTTVTAPIDRHRTPGVVRTPRHMYYFNGAGPWPGVTTVTGVLDKPALTTGSATGRPGRARPRRPTRGGPDAGNVEAAVAFLSTPERWHQWPERGSRIHGALEPILRREPVRSTRATRRPSLALAPGSTSTGCGRSRSRPFLHETPGYGGTCDLIAEISSELAARLEDVVVGRRAYGKVLTRTGFSWRPTPGPSSSPG